IQRIDPVAAADAVPYVVVTVADKVIVAVDVDVAVAPAGTPAPAAASPPRSHCEANTPRNGARGNHSRIVRWVIYRRIGVAIFGLAVDNRGIVGRHIDHLGVCLLYHNYGLALGSHLSLDPRLLGSV